MTGLTLDAGALIAFEKNDRRVVTLIARAVEREALILIPSGVVGQVWRDGSRQARLVRLLASDAVSVEVLDDMRARQAGQLCGVSGTTDIVDASVVLCARAHGHCVATSDGGELRRLDPGISIFAV
jgi:hypothetical protein